MTRVMPLGEVLAGVAMVDVPAISITGLTLDNRQVQPGMAFVAVPGTRQHGLAYAAAAVAAGAVAVLYEPVEGGVVPALPVPLLPVPGLRQRLGRLADRFYGAPSNSLFMVGVTGTDGKTSVTHFVAQALNAGGHAQAAVLGTLGIGLPGALQPATHTTPDALTLHGLLAQLRDQGFKAVAMEVSSHALDQGRVLGVQFDVAVLTNLTRDHLDYHGTVEAYAEAKRKLFLWDSLRAVVLNLDDAFGQRLAAEARARGLQVYGYGVGDATAYPAGSVVANAAHFDHTGIHASVHWQGQQASLAAPVLGQFNLHNLLAALGVLLAKGVPFAEAVARLAHVRVVPGRMERVNPEAKDERLVVVDYAHTPGALASVLQAVRVHARRQVICVFGCGGDRDRGKRPLMAQVAEKLADKVVVTDDNPRSENPQQIVEEIMQGFQHPAQVTVEHDRARAIRWAIAQARPGDAVLIAGKGHETVQILADRTLPFDDRAQAAQALQEVTA